MPQPSIQNSVYKFGNCGVESCILCKTFALHVLLNQFVTTLGQCSFRLNLGRHNVILKKARHNEGLYWISCNTRSDVTVTSITATINLGYMVNQAIEQRTE